MGKAELAPVAPGHGNVGVLADDARVRVVDRNGVLEELDELGVGERAALVRVKVVEEADCVLDGDGDRVAVEAVLVVCERSAAREAGLLEPLAEFLRRARRSARRDISFPDSPNVLGEKTSVVDAGGRTRTEMSPDPSRSMRAN